MLAYAALVCLAILGIVGIVVFASFVQLWPYNLTLTPRHYDFDVQQGSEPLWNSVYVSLIAAGIGIVVTVAAAYLNAKFRNPATRLLYFLAILPAAVPGTVLGLGYILAFNDPANPVNAIYGTFLLLAICNVFHYHAQGFLIASTSVQQISATFDEASATLGAGFLRTMSQDHPADDLALDRQRRRVLLHAQHGDARRGGVPVHADHATRGGLGAPARGPRRHQSGRRLLLLDHGDRGRHLLAAHLLLRLLGVRNVSLIR